MVELLVPIHVNALRLDRPKRVIGPSADYEILPWSDGNRDHNGSVPNIASAINAEPFSDHQIWLDTGVHLHWTLPDGLKRGSSRRSPVRRVRVGDLWFPPAPNRWMVRRFSTAPDGGTHAPDRAWIVESDYVHPGTKRPVSKPIAYPRAKRRSNEPPFLFLGRQIELNPHTFEPVDGPVTPADARTSLATHDAPLTALGPGDPTFAAFYPTCRSVFGLHDHEPAPQDQDTRYDVYGWYSQDIPDPLQRLVAVMYTDPKAGAAILAKKAHENGETLKINPEKPNLTKAQWGRVLFELMGEQLGLSPFMTVDTIPTDMLCHGQFLSDPTKPEQGDPPHSTHAIGFGSSAPEAFAALLAGPQSGSLDEDVEARLVQSLSATDLTNHPLDLGQKLKEARHNEQFRAYRGHSIWVIRPNESDLSEGAGDRLLTLPDDLAHELNLLNELQETFDNQNDAIEGLKQELFSDWHQFMRAAYPEGDMDPFSVDVDAQRELTERTRLEPLERLQRETGRLFHGESPAGNMLLTDDHTVWGMKATNTNPEPHGLIIGGKEGTAFSDAISSAGERIISVNVTFDEVINGIAVVTSTGELGRKGGSWGTLQEIKLAQDEHITAVFGETAHWSETDVVGKLGFETNTRRILGPWGGDGVAGQPFHFEAPLGHVISGIRGRAADHLNAIGILVTPVGQTALSDHHVENAPEVNPESLARRVVEQHRTVLSLLLNEFGAETEFHIGLTPGPRYWQPSDPVIVLDDKQVRTRDHHGHDGPHHEQSNGSKTQLSAAYAFTLSRGWDNSGTAFAGNRRAPSNINDVFIHGQGALGWAVRQDPEKWDPLQLEWEVEVRPLARGANVETGAYKPDFVTSSQMLRDDHTDLEHAKRRGPVAETYEYLSGRSILNPSAGRLLMSRKKDLPSDLSAVLGEVEGTPMVLPLGGFHDALLMRRHEPQLPIEDPIGLPLQAAFAQRVRKALGGLHPTTPMPERPFQPIRSGEIVFGRLRVIDSFGRSREWTPDTVRTLRRMAPAGHAARRARLPVRLSQPARLNFRWLSSVDEDVESNAHPATSPVCGWLLPNDLDGVIDFYDESGRMLGLVDSKGKWSAAPGDRGAPRSWRDINNRNLANVVKWLTHPKSGDLTGNMLETLDEALRRIDPMDAAQHQPRALLIGRPVALVRARISLSLQHHAALDQSLRALRARLAGADGDSHDFETVKFPIRLGEHGQLNDGLCGYWLEDDHRFVDDLFHTPHGINTGAVHSQISVHQNAQLTDYPVQMSLEDQPITVSMLIDPRGSVHATTGILPVKSIAIPPDQYQEQAASLRVTFETAPVLTPANDIEIPLPAEPGYSWSWLERRGDDWVETPHHPTIRKPDLIAAFGKNGAPLWAKLVETGQIAPDDHPNIGVLMPVGQGALPNRFDELGLTVEMVERGLHALAESINPTERRALFRGRPVARQGWLELRPVPKPGSGAKINPFGGTLDVDWEETS